MTSLLPPIEQLQTALQPISEATGLKALPLHAHEILLAFGFYHIIFKYIAPQLSGFIVPRQYQRFSRKVKLDWDLQCVSLVQSVLISGLALWVMFTDDVRKATTPEIRVWGYSGPAGTVQAFATGYFLWDLIVTAQNLESLGLPVLIHAISCLIVYLLGFRPVFNYYSCVFVIFELSTPFLNIHMFLEQLGMTGSTLQLLNGVGLVGVFFCVRLLYGGYSSYQWYMDIRSASPDRSFGIPGSEFFSNAKTASPLPVWLVSVFAVSNLTLNTLNVVWFGVMIKTIMSKDEKSPAKED